MRSFLNAALAATLLVACARMGGEGPCPSGAACAPQNIHLVPRIVSLTVPRAAALLLANKYRCEIRQVRVVSAPAGTVLWQNPRAGSPSFLWLSVHVGVAGPFSAAHMRSQCRDRTREGPTAEDRASSGLSG
jgi:hypothetical protein